MINLADALPRLLPNAIEWARKQQAAVLAVGRQLTARELALATSVGVRNPERVRLELVAAFPQPSHPELRAAARQTELIGPNTKGLTFGYAILMLKGELTTRLLSHELRHVYQYETAGSIEDFLPEYLGQIVTVGYRNAPYELDARKHESDLV